MQTKVTKGISFPESLYEKIEQERTSGRYTVSRSVLVTEILMSHFGLTDPEQTQSAH